MQGYIINLNKVKEEDLIVSILSRGNIHTLYRFYGARHGTINMGFHIDFETEDSAKSTIGRLKDVIHIGFSWIHSSELLHLWQNFIQLFYPHLKDAEDIGDFYYELINNAAHSWSKQNPKRVAIEAYVRLLEHEGRLHREFDCFLCSQHIEEDVSLIRAFLPTHQDCSRTMPLSKEGLIELYTNKSTLFLSDKEVERLWRVLLEGL